MVMMTWNMRSRLRRAPATLMMISLRTSGMTSNYAVALNEESEDKSHSSIPRSDPRDLTPGFLV